MLAVVNQPHIRIEANMIPGYLFEKAVPFTQTRLYKETKAKMTPGENLMLLRKNRGLTQKALAEKSGLAVVAISDMEHKRIPICRESAKKLALALKTSLGNLLW
jgi:DNA-binding XRE family transcriptional regulator